MRTENPWKVAALLLVALTPALAGCKESSASAEPQPAPPEVGVVTVTPQPRTIVRELPGRIAPTRVADVRPRVSGIVIARLFNQGSDVKLGDALYQTLIEEEPVEEVVQRVPGLVELSRLAVGLGEE